MKRRKININPSLFLFAAFFYIDGSLPLFLKLIIFVTMHEASHIITALMFKCKFYSINISPIGERAVIKNIERLSFIKRIFIYASGPLSNFTAALIIFLFFKDDLLIKINMFIGLFNLLPIFPLDGGMIAFHAIGRKTGVLNSAGFIISLSRILGYIMVICGFIQTILFPFNLSLLLIGIFIIHSQENAYAEIFMNFIDSMSSKNQFKNRILPIKIFILEKTGELKSIIRLFSYDSYSLICFKEKNELKYISQDEILFHYSNGKAFGSISDII
ncbi:MAG: site-2 protease family protein [Lachnospiraceae bacterium]|nr:site-2 protease family protein [Lachnospiraceae bacterium]